VISSSLTAPPATPTEGERYIVAASATGAWASWDNSVAHFSGGAWLLLIPQTGWIAWDQAAGGIVTFDVTTGWAALPTGGGSGGSGGPVTYNPFAKRVEIPLKNQFPTDKSTTGATGTITDDPVNGLTITATSGTEQKRLITAKALPAGWDVVEFACASDQTGLAWGSNGFVLMGAAGSFVTIGVGTNNVNAHVIRVLKWLASGTYLAAIQNSVAWEYPS